MARAAAPIFSPSWGSTSTTIGPACATRVFDLSVPAPGMALSYSQAPRSAGSGIHNHDRRVSGKRKDFKTRFIDFGRLVSGSSLRLLVSAPRFGSSFRLLVSLGPGMTHAAFLGPPTGAIATPPTRRGLAIGCSPFPPFSLSPGPRRGPIAPPRPGRGLVIGSSPFPPFSLLPRRKGQNSNAKDQSRQSGRRNGRRRDDPGHLEIHQGKAHLSLSRYQSALFRS